MQVPALQRFPVALPAQSASLEQGTHCPTFALPASVSHTWSPQSAELSHARHSWLSASQIGVLPEHVAFVTQPTHVKVLGSHSAVVPVHADAFVGSHSTHCPTSAPLVSQTPVVPVQSDAWQPRQVSAVVSQYEVGPFGHGDVAVHATHSPTCVLVALVSHTGVAPRHPTPSSVAAHGVQ
jgi:hypothetical protein